MKYKLLFLICFCVFISILIGTLTAFLILNSAIDEPIKIDIKQSVQIGDNQGKKDINNATLYDLQSISGVGETLANRIISYREMHGPIQSICELQAIDGIGLGRIKLLGEVFKIGEDIGINSD